jgi:hypothetical protein
MKRTKWWGHQPLAKQEALGSKTLKPFPTNSRRPCCRKGPLGPSPKMVEQAENLESAGKKNRFAESMMKTRKKSTMVFKPKNADLCNGRDRYTEKGISLVEDD